VQLNGIDWYRYSRANSVVFDQRLIAVLEMILVLRVSDVRDDGEEEHLGLAHQAELAQHNIDAYNETLGFGVYRQPRILAALPAAAKVAVSSAAQ